MGQGSAVEMLRGGVPREADGPHARHGVQASRSVHTIRWPGCVPTVLGAVSTLGIFAILSAPSCGAPARPEAAPRRAAVAGTSTAPSPCLSCHAAKAKDPLGAVHVRAGLDCEGCHRRDEIAAGMAAPPPAPTVASRATMGRIDATCRRCHGETRKDEDLAKRYLHWKLVRGEGKTLRSRCLECHRHED